MPTPATSPAPPDWTKLCEAMYPGLSGDERAALVKIWEVNYARFAALKPRLDATVDPDLSFDPQP
jgi:uncharacterized membrane protein